MTFCHEPKLEAADGKKYETDCATTEIHRVEDSQGFDKLRSDSKAGGDIAGNARKDLEKRLKRSVIKKEIFLNNPESQSRLS